MIVKLQRGVHRGWYSRGYLPHFDQPGLVQGITFRLFDSVPVALRAEWEEVLRLSDRVVRNERLQAYLDAGLGVCWLARPEIGRLVEEALWCHDGERYRLIAWVVMPNHVHTLIETRPGCSLGQIVQTWKGFTARQANALLARQGSFWHRDYYDRYIRDDRHLGNAILYVHSNPVKAGLVQRAEDWPHSSARFAVAPDAGLVDVM